MAPDAVLTIGPAPELSEQVLAAHPSEPHAVQFAAEADLDEILTGQRFQRMRILDEPDRRRLEAATTAIKAQWDQQHAPSQS